MEERLTFEGLPQRSLAVWLFTDVANCRHAAPPALSCLVWSAVGVTPVSLCRDIQEHVLSAAADTEFAIFNAALVRLASLNLEPPVSCTMIGSLPEHKVIS